MSYLVRRNGIYHYRRHVPTDLHALVGKSWWKISLKTGSQREAEVRARAHAVEHDRQIAVARGLSDRERLMRLDGRLEPQLSGGEFQKAFNKLSKHDLAALNLSGEIGLKQFAEASSRVDRLSSSERMEVHAAGGVNAFLTIAAEEAERVEELRSGDPIELEVRLRHLERKASIIRKLGVDRHVAVFETAQPHEMNPLMSVALEQWLKAKQQGPSSAARHRVAIRRFIELNGDITVQQVTKSTIRSYVAEIAKLPDHRRLPTKLRGRVESGGCDTKDLPRISSKTVERHLTSMKALLSWCVAQSFLESNVATSAELPKDRRPHGSKRKAFSRDQLKILLSQIIEEEGVNSDKAWLFKLCAYTGIRLEEAAQLPRKNVRQLDGVWFIEIDDLDGRPLKNASSLKQVPLHRAIRDEFLRWVEGGRGDRVFSSLRSYKGRFANKLSGDFARLMDRAGLTDPSIVFHSLRHMLKKEMMEAEVDPDMRRQILGHAPKTAHDGYAGASLAALERELSKVAAFF